MFNGNVNASCLVLRFIVKLLRAVLCSVRSLRYSALSCVLFDCYVTARGLELFDCSLVRAFFCCV